MSLIKEELAKKITGKSVDELKKWLSFYGDTKSLRQILFNNREKEELCNEILEMMIYVSIIESLVYADDDDYLVQVNANAELFSEDNVCLKLFSNYEQKMKHLYEAIISSNLVTINSNEEISNLLDNDMSKKYSVPTIDFSDKKYGLLEYSASLDMIHHKLNNSGSEKLINLFFGSNRTQNISEHNDYITLACDYLPSESIAVGKEQEEIFNGNEITCFTDKIKFRYIVLPGGREPTDAEVRLAHEYNLEFVKVQDNYTTIDNPKPISEEYLVKNESDKVKDLEMLKKLRDNINIVSLPKPRKIAVFADPHALFEPTLAVLEDARKNGIEEIYSLGDNIGTGPNPRQVVELLEEYGVKSLKGNHELYATIGADYFKEHLDRANDHAYNDAVRNSGWTRMQLTNEQLKKIAEAPESLILEIGGKKILLSHYIKDYNTNQAISIAGDIDHVFQGHKHFMSNKDNVTTLRGVGIGESRDPNGHKHEAYYIVLTERPEGGYSVEERKVPYDYNNLYYDIMDSDMNSYDKDKIQRWAGVKR